MKYFNKLKNFIIQFLIVYIFFIGVYVPLCYLLNQEISYGSIILGVVCCTLVATTRIMVKKIGEENQELIRNNYWKLKNELNKKTSGLKKRKNNSK